MVKLLSDALAHSGLVGRSAQGRVGGGRSAQKGKGKAVDRGSRKLGGGSCIIVRDFFEE